MGGSGIHIYLHLYNYIPDLPVRQEEQCTLSNPCLGHVVTHFVGHIQKVGHILYQLPLRDR